MKTNKGITLVSLVVTIIILIILAGVSIHATLGENGILTLAKKAKENMELAQIEEETKLNELYSQLVTGDMDVGDVSHDTSEKIKELQDTITRLEAEKAEKENELIEKNNIIDSLNETIRNLTEQIEQLKREKEELSSSLQEEIRIKDEQIKTLTEQLTQVQEELTDAQKEITRLNSIIADLNTQITEQQEAITRLQEELASVRQDLLEANAENEELRKAIEEKDTQIDSLNSTLSKTTATVAHILKDYTAYSKVQLITGTMVNNTAINTTLNAGQSYTIPQGYHSGSGKVTATSLSSQTQATATASNITKGKTAWVNGSKITGTMTDNGAVNRTLTAGQSYTIRAGYHNGSGEIIAADLSSQTQATATASDIARGKTAWVNGSKVTGTMGKKSKKLCTATVWFGKNTSIDLKSYLSDYQQYTKDDFLLVPNSVGGMLSSTSTVPSGKSITAGTLFNKSVTYSSSTGILTYDLNADTTEYSRNEV